MRTRALAAVVIAAAIGLFEFADLRRIFRIQQWEFWLSIVCFVGVAVFGVIPGIGVAIHSLGYASWGEGMLAELKGIFAVVLWDVARDVLLGVRDRMGIYPFYYALADGDLLLSVSQEALVQQPRVSRELNRAHLADRLCGR